MKRRDIFFLIIFLGMILLPNQPAIALTQHGNQFLRISAGGFFPLIDDDNPTIQVANGIWTEAEWGLALTRSWEASLQLGWGRTGLSFQGQRVGHLKMFPVSLALRYRLFPEDNVVPFFWGSLGYSFNQEDEDEIKFDVANHFLWRIGAGADFFLTSSWVIRVDGRYQGNETRFSSGDFRHTIDLGAFVTTIGIVWYW